MSSKMEDLREILFDTIRGVKSGVIPLDRAKAVGDLTQVVVNSAKVEVEFLRATNGKGVGTGFLGEQLDEAGKPIVIEERVVSTDPKDTGLPKGIVGIRQHRMGDTEPGQD